MLAPPDAALARRDPALPGLATVLDSAEMSVLLTREVPAIDARLLEVTYVRYKPGTSCIVGYRLTGRGEPRLLYVKAHATTTRAKFERERARGTRAIDPLMVLIPFAEDRGLRGVAKLEPTHRPDLWRRLAPERQELCRAEIKTLRYKPERRYVAAALIDGTAASVLRFYTEKGFDKARTRAAAFEPRDGLRIPRLIGSTRRNHVLAMEWAPGETLDTVLAGHAAPGMVATRVGHALAELHLQDASRLQPQSLKHFVRHLKAVARDVGTLSPPLGGRALRIAKRLARKLEAKPCTACPVHGDFHAGQVLVTDGSITVLDFDRAVRADPAEDLGMFLAHLERQRLNGAIRRADEITGGLLAGYGARAAHVPRRNVELYAAAGLLRLAPHAFRDREPDWPQSMAAMIERAEQLLEMRSHARVS